VGLHSGRNSGFIACSIVHGQASGNTTRFVSWIALVTASDQVLRIQCSSSNERFKLGVECMRRIGHRQRRLIGRFQCRMRERRRMLSRMAIRQHLDRRGAALRPVIAQTQYCRGDFLPRRGFRPASSPHHATAVKEPARRLAHIRLAWASLRQERRIQHLLHRPRTGFREPLKARFVFSAQHGFAPHQVEPLRVVELPS